jgi:hypothetical protein
MKRLFVAAMAATAISLAWIGTASADCDSGPQYTLEVQDGSVAICLDGSWVGGCPDAGLMLRENVTTGEVVALYTLCEPSLSGTPCYVDECAPGGSYRYGLEVPFECYEASCWPTPFYGEITVPSDPQNCTMSEDNPGPSAYDKPSPWANSENGYVCDPEPYDSGPPPDNGSDDGGLSSSGGSSSGCSIASTGSRMVLSVNAIAFLLGLLLLARRRRT